MRTAARIASIHLIALRLLFAHWPLARWSRRHGEASRSFVRARSEHLSEYVPRSLPLSKSEVPTNPCIRSETTLPIDATVQVYAAVWSGDSRSRCQMGV
jgi:hypothetical protein